MSALTRQSLIGMTVARQSLVGTAARAALAVAGVYVLIEEVNVIELSLRAHLMNDCERHADSLVGVIG